jgi:hypothetical protein
MQCRGLSYRLSGNRRHSCASGLSRGSEIAREGDFIEASLAAEEQFVGQAVAVGKPLWLAQGCMNEFHVRLFRGRLAEVCRGFLKFTARGMSTRGIVSTRYVPALLPNYPCENGMNFFILPNILTFSHGLFLIEA